MTQAEGGPEVLGATGVEGVGVVAGLVLAEPEAEEGNDDTRQKCDHGERT